MNKTTYENEVEIRYDDGIECETFRMDTVDFGTFLAPLNENIGIVLRDRKNYRNGILTIPDQRTYHSFLEELTYQRINVMRNETTGVAYLSFSKAKKEIHVKYDEKNITRYTLQEKATEDDIVSDDAEESTNCLEDDETPDLFQNETREYTLESILEEDPTADVREVKQGIALMQRHSKQVLKHFYN